MANETHQLNIVANLRDNVSKGAATLNQNIQKLREGTRKLVGDNDALAKATRKVTDEERDLIRQRNILEGQQKRLNNEIQKENLLIQKSAASIQDKSKAADRLTKREQELTSVTEKLNKTYREHDRVVTKTSASVDKLGTRIRNARTAFNDAGRDVDRNSNRWQKFAFSLDEAGNSSRKLEQKLARLGRSMLGLGIASVIIFIHSLTSAFTALAGQAVALAGSLTYAASVLGGTFVAAAAQAIPVVGILVATMSRLSAVMEAVNQQGLIQKQAGQEAASGLEQHKEAANAVAEAQRAQQEAQEDLNQARKDGKQEIEDLMYAERQAELQFERSVLAQRESRAALTDAIQSGDISGVASAQLDVRGAALDRQQSKTGMNRAKAEADRARRSGVSGLDSVKQATEALADANRRLAESHREAGVAATQQSSAENSLQYFLDQLSPAEKELYKTIVRVKKELTKLFQPVTDEIIGSITKGIDRFASMLSDPKIIGGFQKLAEGMSDVMDKLSGLLTNDKSREFWVDMLGEAAKNLKPIGRILSDVWRIFRNIATAAAPVLHELLGDIAGFVNNIARDTKDGKGLSEFFDTGKKHLDAWFDLLGAIVSLWGELMNVSGDSALMTLADVTERIQSAAQWLQDNPEAATEWFNETSEAVGYLFDILVALGEELIRSFDPESVRAFATIMDEVIIPGLGMAIRVLGGITVLIGQIVEMELFGDTSVGNILAYGVMLKIVFGSLGLLKELLKGILGPLRLVAGYFSRIVAAIGASGIGSAIAGWFGKMGTALRGGAGKLRSIVRGVLTRAFAAVSFVAGLAAEIAATLVSNIGKFVAANAARIRAIGAIIGRGLILGIILALPLLVPEVWKLGKELGEKVSDKWGDVGYEIGLALGNGLRGALNDVVIPVLNFFIERANDAMNAIDFALPGEQFGTIDQIDPIMDPEAQKRANDALAEAVDVVDLLNKKSIQRNDVARKTIEMTQGETSVNKQQEASLKQLNTQFEHGTLELGLFAQANDKGAKKADELADNTDRAKKNTKAQGDQSKKTAKDVDKLTRSFGGAAGTSKGLGDMVKEVTNKILKSFGAEELKFTLPSVKDLIGGASSAIGAVTGLIGGQTGGFFGNPNERGLDDRIIKVAGGEAILTGHQQQYANNAMALAKAQGAPYGSLGELFQNDSRPHATAPRYQNGGWIGSFAKGGNVPSSFPDAMGALPGLDAAAWFLGQKFGLDVSSGLRPGAITTSGNPSDHGWGGAVDMSNGITTPQMDAAWKYLAATIGGGGTPSPGSFTGGLIKQMLYRTMIGGDHFNHIHLALVESAANNAQAVIQALSGGDLSKKTMRMLAASGVEGVAPAPKFKPIKVKGPKGPILDMLQGQADKLRKEANKKIGKESGAMGATGAAAGNYKGPLNKTFPEHQLGQPGVQLSEQQVRGLAAKAGLPPITFGQIAHGESNFYPGVIGNDPNGYSHGRGLWQITPEVQSAATRAKLESFGAYSNPWANALQAKYLFDASGGTIRPWYGTQYVTDFTPPYKQHGGYVGEFATGGTVPGSPGKPYLATVHGGEHITAYQGGGDVPSERIPSNPIKFQNYSYQAAADALMEIARMQDTNNFGPAIKALTDFLREGGILDDLAASIEEMITFMASAVTKWTYKIRKGIVGMVRTNVELANRQLDDLEEIGEALGETMDLLRGSMANVKQRIKQINKELKKEENKKAREELQDQRDQLRTALEDVRNRIQAINDQIAQNLSDRYAAMQAIFEAKIGRFDQRRGIVDTRRAILEAQNAIATPEGEEVDNTNTQGFIEENSKILRQEERFLQRQLEKARKSGDKERQRELRQALLDNQLAQLENTQAIKDLNEGLEEAVNEVFSFNSTAWQLWRSAIFNGMGGVLPQYSPIPSLATGGMVTTGGLVNLHAGEVVVPADGVTGDTNVYITEPMEVADPVAVSNAISWKLKQTKV